MIKKKYIQPLLTVEKVEEIQLLNASQGTTSDIGIDFGGVDDDGTMPVDSRSFIWNEEGISNILKQ